MITLAWPWLLLALPLPLLPRWLLPPAYFQSGRALRPPRQTALAGALAELACESGRTTHWKRLAGVSIWLFLLVAAARPQWLGEPVALPVAGRDLMLAVDISGSMEQSDYTLAGRPATRLSVVKAAASRFIARRNQDRIGLILFGTRPYVQTPLTYDHETVAQMLSESVVGLAGRDTAIGDAIGLGIKRLREQPFDNRILVLLTDGANSAGTLNPAQAAALAAESGVRIYAIGLGGPIGSEGAGGFRLERAADDLDLNSLRTIAMTTGGHAFHATDAQELAQVYAQLDRLEPTIRDHRIYRPAVELYPFPLAAALLLSMALAVLLGSRQGTGSHPNKPNEGLRHAG